MPLVTVVTCTYGRPDELRRAIASIEKQTFRDFTHVIVEDGGNSPSIQDMGLPESLTLMTLEHRTGWPGFICRNVGAREATTDLVAFLDDDNWYEPDHLACLVKTLQETNSDFVWSSTRLFHKGDFIGYRRTAQPLPGHVDVSELLCKRALFVGSGGLDPRDAEPGDGFLCERWAYRGARYANSPRYTLNYNVNSEERRDVIYRGCVLGMDGYSLEP